MDGVSPQCVPDLIAFRAGKAPIIVDWKVHVFGRMMPGCSSVFMPLALGRCTPHTDFPAGTQIESLEVELYEAQLLTTA